MKRIDVEALYVALDHRRRQDGLTWGRIAQEVGSSSSAVSRLGRGTVPSADVFVRLLAWLDCTDFSVFVRDEERTP